MGNSTLDITLDPRSAVPLYEQICQQIREKIESRELAPGAPLPTNHEFCARLQVSYTTAQQAMATLAKEGYVTRQARRGTVVKGIPRRGVVGIYAFIELFGHNSKYEYYRLLMKHLTRQLEANGRVYRTYLGSEQTNTSSMADEDLLRHMAGGTLCGAILVNPPHNVAEVVRQGREVRVPVVAMVGGCDPDYSVWVDYAGSIRAMATHLVKQGRRRVGIVFSRVSLTLRDPKQIARIMTEAGCPPQSNWVVGRDDNEAGGYEAMSALPLDEIDGLIITDDMMTLGADQRLAELNIDMPDKLMACTFWNHGSRLHLKKSYELFELDVERFAHGGLELMQNIIKGQRVPEPHVKFVLAHQPWYRPASEHGDAVSHHRRALLAAGGRTAG